MPAGRLMRSNCGSLDAIITNAAGCGSHLKSYGLLLDDDPKYSRGHAHGPRRFAIFTSGFARSDFESRRRRGNHGRSRSVTYHEACHLCHGQKITRQPREILAAIPACELIEIPESTWCCGSAGIYNITQPEMAAKLQERKLRHIVKTGASIVATANPGLLLAARERTAQVFDTRLRCGIRSVSLRRRIDRKFSRHVHRDFRCSGVLLSGAVPRRGHLLCHPGGDDFAHAAGGDRMGFRAGFLPLSRDPFVSHFWRVAILRIHAGGAGRHDELMPCSAGAACLGAIPGLISRLSIPTPSIGYRPARAATEQGETHAGS